MTGERTLRDVGEFAVIDRIVSNSQIPVEVAEVGPGDDAAVLAATDGRVVACVDVLVEGRHFRRDWSSAIEVGKRAAAASLSDVNAMGARATSVLVGLVAPADLPLAWVNEMAAGLTQECTQAGAVLAGGDTTEGDAIVISVTALGSLDGRAPITRAGAQPGDRVAVCGRLGWAAAGLAVLGRGFRSPKALVDAHRYPQIDYDAGRRAAVSGARAMIDVSDGLIADLGHIARASGVQIDITTEGNVAFEVPEPMQAAAAAYNVDARGWMLTGGDDHALVAAFPADVDLPEGFVQIGVVREQAGQADESSASVVTVDGSSWDDGSGGPGGFTHFG